MATNRPSVAVMINEAIATLNEKGGSSLHAVKKYIAATYKVDVQKLDSHLKKALKRGVESGSLTKPTGKGATGSFKLADKPNTMRKPVGGKGKKTKKHKVAVYPNDKKVAKEVKATSVRVSPKKARANKKFVDATRASKPPAKKEAAASKKELAAEANVPEVNSLTTMVPKVAEKEKTKSSSDPDGFLKILRIDLVVEGLLKYLDLKGMKALTSVSKDALIAVRNSKVFSRRVKFRICKDSMRSRVLENCFHSWKCVVLNLSIAYNEFAYEYVPDPSNVLQSLDSVQSIWVSLSYHPNVGDYELRKLKSFGLKIIESSRETLIDLTLSDPCFELDGIESIHFPNLKRLTFINQKLIKDEKLDVLLKNLPALEELCVKTNIPSQVIAGFQGRTCKLRKLEIHQGFTDEVSTPPPAVDWNMVAGNLKLEDINIQVSYYSKRFTQDVEQMLCSISAETVKKIFVYSTCSDTTLGFRQKLSEHISRFTGLTELTLRNLLEFDDDSLQSIIKRCSKLKKLALFNLSKLTDFGFSGVRRSATGDSFHSAWNDRGVSLTDLKDLVGLSICHCGSVDLATLLGVIRFEFLNSVIFSAVFPSWKTIITPRHFLLGILQQNPSLKSILVRMTSWVNTIYSTRDSSLEDEVKALYPRIQRLELTHFYAPSEPQL